MEIKIGICIWSIPVDGYEEKLRFAAANSLRGVELEVGSYEEDFPLSGKELQTRYMDLQSELDLVYPAMGCNALCDYGMSDPSQREIVFLAIDKTVGAASAMGIPLIQLPSFVKGWIATTEDFDSTVECLRYACERAAEHGLLVGSENGLSADDQHRLMECVSHESLRVYFDTANPRDMADLEPAPILDVLYPHVCEVHLKDGGTPGGTLLGEGHAHFADSVEILKKNNYQGWMLLENAYRALMKSTGRTAEDLILQDVMTTTHLVGA